MRANSSGASGSSVLGGMNGLFVLPESLPPARRARFAWGTANPLGSLSLLRSHAELLGLSAVHFVSMVAHEALPTTFVLYVGYRYGWDNRTVGLTLATFGVGSALIGPQTPDPLLGAVESFGNNATLDSWMNATFAPAAGSPCMGKGADLTSVAQLLSQ